MKSTGTEFNEIAIELSREPDKRRLRRRLYWDVPYAVEPGHLIHLKRIIAQGQQASRETQLLKDQILRARADLENSRKRAQRDREELVKRANEGLLGELLGVLDHFELGIRSGKQHDGTTRQFVEGIEMSFNEMLRLLANYGLVKIEADGQPFDPYYHEAVGTDNVDELPDNQVTAVLREGYIYQGKVIRPSMVRVNKKH